MSEAKVYTLEQIKVESLAKSSKFFTKEVKNAYKSRYSKRIVQGELGVFFVTSEEIPSTTGVPERRFAVRSFNPVSGEVTLVTALGAFPTDYAAHVHAKKIANPVPVVATQPEAPAAAPAPEGGTPPAGADATPDAALTAAAAESQGAEVIPLPVAANG